MQVPVIGTIYNCTKGHLVCTNCYKGPTSDCSLCRTRMHKNVSLLATTVIENIEHRCRFETDGCKVRSLVGEAEGHRKICNFRTVSCPSLLCEKKLPFNQVTNHLKNECSHSFKPSLTVQTDSLSMILTHEKAVTPRTSKVSLINWKWKVFFLNKLVDDDGQGWFYLQMLGSEQECDKCMVTIRVEDNLGIHSVVVTDSPLSIDVPEKFLRANGMLISSRIMKKIWKPQDGAANRFALKMTLKFAENVGDDCGSNFLCE